MTNSSSFIYLVVALILGVILGFLIGRGRQKVGVGLDQQNIDAQIQLSAEKARSEQLALQITQLTEQRAKEQEENTAQLELRKELEALKSQVTAFSSSALDADRRRAEAEKEIQTRINEMKENNSELAKNTGAIAKVLSSSQARGRFGEAQLEKLLENAGLVEGQHYHAQRAIDHDGADVSKPDVTIAMPGGSEIYIDSKFPFEAYFRAYEVEDETTRNNLLKEHAKVVRDHIKVLSGRGYAQKGASPDFVILFAPVESVLVDALHVDPQLLEYAFQQRITIATPTSMMALLRTIGYLFSREKAAQNAREIQLIAENFLGNITKLYEKIAKLGRSVNTLVTSYNDLIPTAEQTVLTPARKMRQLDVQGPMAPTPPSIDASVREIRFQGAVDAIEGELIADGEIAE